MNKKKIKVITLNLIFVTLIFSIFTSFNNIAIEKSNVFAQESKSLSFSSLSIKENNISKIQQQQQNQKSSNISSILQKITFKNIKLSPDLTVKINQI